jgi:YidC/Oxa1 family membrane protein insertase
MSLFDQLIVQPIFNVLVLIYGIVPGGDFGVAIILFTVLIRLLMWPLVKKQLHQTKAIRQIQPELKKIKARAKGNKQLEAQMMMELYREKGVNPFSSIGLLIVQLPIFIALYQVINIITQQRDRIAEFTYGPLESLSSISSIIQTKDFNETLLGIVNLAEKAITPEGLYIPVVVLAIVAAGAQYYQARQTMPKPQDGQRLRDMLKQQAAGKEVDQSEITAAVSGKMVSIIPLMTFGIGMVLPGALVLYFAVSSLVAIIQQHIVLNRDVDEMEAEADKKVTVRVKTNAKQRADKAIEAEIVQDSVELESQPVVTTTSKKKQSTKKRKRR